MNSESRQKQAYRDQIIAIAQKIFEHYGYKKTTIGDIAKTLKIGKSSIYYYFKSKEEIYIAVLETEANQLKKEVLAAVEKATHPEAKLRAYFETRMLLLKNLHNLNSYIQNNFLPDEHIAKLRNTYDTIEVSILHDILLGGIKNGNFKIKNPQLTAVLLLTIIKGLELPVLAETKAFIQERINELLPILFHGISVNSHNVFEY